MAKAGTERTAPAPDVPRSKRQLVVALVAVVVTVVVFALVGAIVALWPPTPGEDSVDAGFARDMAVHHTQAVEMAEIIRQRTTDDELGYLATDIVLTQQVQIGMMGGWLDVWGLRRTRTGVQPMAWAGMSMGPAMPGMASRKGVSSLRTAPIERAERKFLELMIAHHRGGVHMAEAALQFDLAPVSRQLASSITTTQKSEIKVMTAMIAKRSGTS